MTAPAPGGLWIVGTPIGNLGDVSLRALDTLRNADVIAAEDTRHTRLLLAHHGIDRPLVSYREENSARAGADLLERMRRGARVALVSDAGTPAVSDPGADLVARAAAEGIPVTVIPGPSAITAALAASGFSGAEFTFVGFLPRPRGRRRRLFQEFAASDRHLVFFESPRRILGALADLAETLPDRPVALARELTKMHEQVLRGLPAQVMRELGERPRGEITVVVAGRRAAGRGAPQRGRPRERGTHPEVEGRGRG